MLPFTNVRDVTKNAAAGGWGGGGGMWVKNQLLWPFNFLRYLLKTQVELSRELRSEV